MLDCASGRWEGILPAEKKAVQQSRCLFEDTFIHSFFSQMAGRKWTTRDTPKGMERAQAPRMAVRPMPLPNSHVV